jgi:CRP/FNR family transcriptional regulator, cyclic AMP receptor protein
MSLEPDVCAALARSRFGALPDELLARLTAGAVRVDVPAGTDLISPESRGRLLLVVAGVFKTYLIAHNGRQATIRYTRPGDLLGCPTVFDDRPSGAGARPLTAATALLFHMEAMRALATSDVRVAHVLNLEMTERLYAYFAELAGTTFGSLRERVIRHLLDVASEQQRGAVLVANLSQQELADAVGSVREVVARVLGKLRQDGLVRTSEGGVELLEPARLAELSAPGVTNVTPSGDLGH